MKILLPMALLSAVVLTGCGAGGIINPQPTSNIPIESTSTSANPGTLEAFQSAVNYTTDYLKNSVLEQICPKGTPADRCEINKANLLSDFNFNLDQITNGYKVSAYTIQYNTPGVKNENRSVSGGVLIPQIDASQIKGIVLYYHGTRLSKYNVPSCYKYSQAQLKYCLYNSSNDGETLGGVLASQGYIVVMPDYIGQGYDNVVLHPYVLYAKENATSGLNMLIATKALLTNLQIGNISNNLYITGYSEGGAYALWTSKLVQDTSSNFLQNNNLNLKNTVGLSGAYDLVNAQLPMETANLKVGDQFNIGDQAIAGIAKPLLTGYLLSSYGFYDLNQTYTSLMTNAFLACRTCLISGNNLTTPDLFTVHGNPELTDANITLYLTTAAATTGYGNGNNSAKALIADGLLENSQFVNSLTANSINTWSGGTSPISLVYLNKDSVVTNLNSINAYSQITNPSKAAIVVDTERYKYGNEIDQNVKPFDHAQSNIIELIAALKQFNTTP
ncbi:MAG: hypothetical protein K0R94_498 [Burkholderiales bacterium]|nr:hypothetical protein [Burkholderiales bacterium]